MEAPVSTYQGDTLFNVECRRRDIQVGDTIRFEKTYFRGKEFGYFKLLTAKVTEIFENKGERVFVIQEPHGYERKYKEFQIYFNGVFRQPRPTEAAIPAY